MIFVLNQDKLERHPSISVINDLSLEDLQGLRNVNIYIDEYLLFTEKRQKNIFNNINNNSFVIDKVFIRSTPVRRYNQNVFELARISNIQGKDYTSLLNDEYVEEYLYLKNNLLTHPDTVLIHDSRFDFSYLSKEQYQTDILGKLFK